MTLLHDRERRHTAADVLRRIDGETTARLRECADAGKQRIDQRLVELDREWDTDRAVELEAAITGLAGLALGAAVRSGFLLMPAVVGAAVVTHAVTGWHPLLPLLRRLGLRTSREIERERYALKALRGDFDGMTGKEVRHASR